MTKYIVNHAAGLFLPGAEAASPHGAEVDIKGDNAAVSGWIKAGLLVAPKDFAKPVAAAADPKVQAALDQAMADLAERDATIAAQSLCAHISTSASKPRSDRRNCAGREAPMPR